MDAAMQTAVPTISAVALPAMSVQPNRKNTKLVPSNVAIVIPDVGFDVTPTRPTIRELTVTKKNANRAMRIDATPRTVTESRYPSTPGVRVRSRSTAASTTPTVRNERSRSVRSRAESSPAESCPRPMRNDSIIVGIDLISVMIPPVATAPAPM